MNVSQLNLQAIRRQLSAGLTYQVGPISLKLTANLPELIEQFSALYAHYPVLDESIVDFSIKLKKPNNVRRWIKPQVLFESIPNPNFAPFPLEQAFPMLEWGTNWCIATQSHQYLLFHSAVVEKNGQAIIFPAYPGSGKSTLCAALALSGWRMLSDEFGVFRAGASDVLPLPKLIPLKNNAVDVIRHFSSDAFLGPTFKKTRKGDLAHFRPPKESIEKMHQSAQVKWIVFPKYEQNVGLNVESVTKSRALMRLANNSFNYHVVKQKAFETTSKVVQASECLSLTYSDLDRAIAYLDSLVSS